MSFQGVLTDRQIQNDPQQQLRGWKREHDFAICVDTDGCALDNMWAKQLIVFHPHFMDMNSLRGAEMHFRIHAEHHNLWGTTRGCDRYVAVQLTLNSLLNDPQAAESLDEARARDLLTSIQGYVDWIDDSGGEKAFGIPSLTEYHEMNGLDYNITRLLGWSEAVDRTFEFVTLTMEPFPGVRRTLEWLSERADMLVVSGTPYSDLAAWWTNTGLSQYMQSIAGKEMGKKAEHIRLIQEAGGYEPEQMIMIGDGGGDLRAAKANGVLFYPTPAGREVEAWESARGVFEKFFAGQYAGTPEDQKIAEFQGVLEEQGPWEKDGYDAREEYLKLQDKRIATYGELHPNGRLFVLDV